MTNPGVSVSAPKARMFVPRADQPVPGRGIEFLGPMLTLGTDKLVHKIWGD